MLRPKTPRRPKHNSGHNSPVLNVLAPAARMSGSQGHECEHRIGFWETQTNRAMVEYMTWIYTEQGRTFFFARAAADDSSCFWGSSRRSSIQP